MWMLVSVLGWMFALCALAVLARRAVSVVELRWDAPMYHYPFAALRGGLGVPYVLPESLQRIYEGFPPLPHAVQGALWRLTGDMRAVGATNLIALLAFAVGCAALLRAPLWLVVTGALTIPHVIIQSGTAYVDLFANVGLALALAIALAAVVFPDEAGRGSLPAAVIGLAVAAWSKFQLAPLVGVVFVLLFGLGVWRPRAALGTRRRVLAWLVVGATVASAPYVKNAIAYGNPFWPVRVPIVGARLPYTFVNQDRVQRPQALAHLPQPLLFAHSVLEIDHPRRYTNRPRWLIDQGSASVAFRMGGFWAVGVLTSVLIAVVGTLRSDARRGAAGVALIAGMIAVVSVMPQSHELRYYLFLPLTLVAWNAALLERLRHRFPSWCAAVAVIALVGAGYMVRENRFYYGQSPVDRNMAATSWGAAAWWSLFTPGVTYCAVGVAPIGIFLTGPSMRDYGIVERDSIGACPRGMPIATMVMGQRRVISGSVTAR